MELALLYTLQCTARCMHCGLNCSPNNKSKMKLNKVERYIREASDIYEIEKIVFSGGEPLLFNEEICRLISLTTKLGMSSRIVTNAFWATSQTAARKIVEDLADAGLTNINFSADMFHQQYVAPQNIKFAIQACHEFGLIPLICRCVTKDSFELQDFLSLYGLNQSSVIDVNDIPEVDKLYVGNHRFKIQEKYKDKILLRTSNIIPRGRAQKIRHYCRKDPFGEVFNEPCPEIIRKPGVFPNGDFYACCCSGKPVGRLRVGNLEKTSLERLYTDMYQNPVFRFLSEHGPYKFAKLLEGRDMIQNPPDASSICEICLNALEAWDGLNFHVLLQDYIELQFFESLGSLKGL